eukprot:COSAG01_NODE_1083_length_11812_cov_9.648510_3_plen_1662_part_00
MAAPAAISQPREQATAHLHIGVSSRHDGGARGGGGGYHPSTSDGLPSQHQRWAAAYLPGQLFKELDAKRRPNGADMWEVKGGSRGHHDLQQWPPSQGGGWIGGNPDLLLRRSYGTLTLKAPTRLALAAAASNEGGTAGRGVTPPPPSRFKYNQYTVEQRVHTATCALQRGTGDAAGTMAYRHQQCTCPYRSWRVRLFHVTEAKGSSSSSSVGGRAVAGKRVRIKQQRPHDAAAAKSAKIAAAGALSASSRSSSSFSSSSDRLLPRAGPAVAAPAASKSTPTARDTSATGVTVVSAPAMEAPILIRLPQRRSAAGAGAGAAAAAPPPSPPMPLATAAAADGSSSSSSPPSPSSPSSQSSQSSSSLPHVLDDDGSGDAWMQFDDEEGECQGRIVRGVHGGAKFQTRQGDVAEWFPRVPGERDPDRPFEEGSVVGLWDGRLSHRTAGAQQLGVVSRMAAIEASAPLDRQQRARGDFIAYLGRVPIRCRRQGEKPKANGWAVPSGHQDGTAVVVNSIRRPSACLGRVVKVDPVGSSNFELTALQGDSAIDMVEISVLQPSITVRSDAICPFRHRKMRYRRAWLLAVAFVFTCAAAAYGLLASSVRQPPAGLACTPIHLANGTLRGECDGVATGDTCVYQGCDTGYTLVLGARDGPAAPVAAAAAAAAAAAPVTPTPSPPPGFDSSRRSESVPIPFPACDQAQGCAGEGLFCARVGSSCRRCAQPRSAAATLITDNTSTRSSAGEWSRRPLQQNCMDDDGVSCSHSNGAVCQASAIPTCTACQRPAGDSNVFGCELSGTPWGASIADAVLHSRALRRAYDLRDQGAPAVYCLSAESESRECIENSIPGWSSCEAQTRSPFQELRYNEGCQFRQLAQCNSQKQRQNILDALGSDFQIRQCSVGLQKPAAGGDATWLVHHPRQMQQIASNERTRRPNPARTCTADRGYDGTVMHCAPVSCPAEYVSATSIQRCHNCAGVDAILHFPATAVGTAAITIACPPQHNGHLTRSCGSAGWNQVSGECTRKSCPTESHDVSEQMWSYLTHGEAAQWPSLNSSKYDSWVSPVFRGWQRTVASVHFDATVEGEKVTVDCPSWRPFVGAPTFTGRLVRECLPAQGVWGAIQGVCRAVMCPAGLHRFKFRSAKASGEGGSLFELPIRMPSAGPGQLVTVPCCAKFTKAGGCADAHAALGQIEVVCSQNATWPSEPLFGTCLPPASIAVRHDASHKEAARMFRMLRAQLEEWGKAHGDGDDDATSAATAKQWMLPSNGTLSTVSVSLTGGSDALSQWHPVVGLPPRFNKMGFSNLPFSENQKSMWSLDSCMPGEAAWRGTSIGHGTAARRPTTCAEAGRAAAATATVACRALGYRGAAAVLNCGSLLLMEQESPLSNFTCSQWRHNSASSASEGSGRAVLYGSWQCERWDGIPSPLVAELCGDILTEPYKTQDTWLTVGPEHDNPSEWLGDAVIGPGAVSAQCEENRSHSAEHSDRGDVPAPGGGGGACDGVRLFDRVKSRFPDNDACHSMEARQDRERAALRSTCVGDEHTLGQCLVSQLGPVIRQGVVGQQQPLKLATMLARHTLLVGCTDDETSTVTAGGNGGGDAGAAPAAGGTWVIGDKVTPHSRSNMALARPKVFRETGPRNCSLGSWMGREWVDVESAYNDCDWGWGWTPK